MRYWNVALVAAMAAALSLVAAPAGASPLLDQINGSLQTVPGGEPAPASVAPTTTGIAKFHRQTVSYTSHEPAGTIVIDPNQKFLYFILGDGRAIRYGIGVGKEGFGWHGVVYVGWKKEWPVWTPPSEMVARSRQEGRNLPDHMAGGPGNPLGARALYLFDGFSDTAYRIHGTNDPSSIGHNVSSGCFRMYNEDVIDLYNRAPIGTRVVVL